MATTPFSLAEQAALIAQARRQNPGGAQAAASSATSATPIVPPLPNSALEQEGQIASAPITISPARDYALVRAGQAQ